jgi:hypothetical protein
MNINMRPEKYVVLEHLTLPDRGFRFWSFNSEDNTHSAWGDLWYKEILFTDSEEEAIAASQKLGEIATMHELEEYYRNKFNEEENEQTEQNND